MTAISHSLFCIFPYHVLLFKNLILKILYSRNLYSKFEDYKLGKWDTDIWEIHRWLNKFDKIWKNINKYEKKLEKHWCEARRGTFLFTYLLFLHLGIQEDWKGRKTDQKNSLFTVGNVYGKTVLGKLQQFQACGD